MGKDAISQIVIPFGRQNKRQLLHRITIGNGYINLQYLIYTTIIYILIDINNLFLIIFQMTFSVSKEKFDNFVFTEENEERKR